jgi:uncharacterized protein
MKNAIPELALQQHIAVLGKTGSGKSYVTKAIIVEPLLEAGRRVGVVDPTGAWWGLRSSRDGKGPGFKVLILGGDHGDLPLPALGGAAVARLLVEQGVNLVADTSQLTVGERTRWFIDFAGTLYRINRAPLHLVLDEAHNFAPKGKIPDPDTGKMLHAANTLASGGRSRGIRLTMITQRPQKLHNDALTSADTLIAMRVLAPHDRMAVEDWIKGCGDPAQGKEVLNSLARLQRGEGWVWYPEGGHLQRSKFPPIRTFDSSATPDDGHAIAAPKAAAEVDLTEIRAALADAVKEAEASDPKLLRKRIAELQDQLEDARRQPLASADALDEAERRGYARALGAVLPITDRLTNLGAGITEQIEAFRADLQRLAGKAPLSASSPALAAQGLSRPKPWPAPAARDASDAGATLQKAERLVLTALAQYPQGRTKVQVAVLTGYAVGGGGFNNAIGSLRSAGRLEGESHCLKITEAGLVALGSYDRLPTGRALFDYWCRQLGKAERKCLEALAEVYPRTLSKQQVAARAGYDANGGGFNNALGKLRTLELINGRGEIRANEALFDG